MADQPEYCARCGTNLKSIRVEGLCPVCLLEDSQDFFSPDPPEDEPPAQGPGLLNLRGYCVLREIDRGGMGIVYEALQANPERRVAVKMLLPHLLEAREMRERFRGEAQAMSSLDHPGVLPVYEVGDHAGLPFFCMKLAQGGSLQHRAEYYRGKWRETARLTAHLADAVQCAHDHGVLHRDLKPGNVLFDEAGRAYVTDFGLAKRTDTAFEGLDLTRSTAVLGTPHYLAPEWASGSSRSATTAGDVYGLGAILYFLLTGRPPHHASDSLPALLREIADTPPPAPGPETPRDLGIICRKAMEKDPARRYVSAAALADDLRRWLEGRPILARSASLAEKAWRMARRNPLPASLMAALALAITGGGAALWNAYQLSRSRLHDSLVAQAAVMRETGQLGQESLKILSEAAVLKSSPQAREEMISALALPDWREVRRFPYEDTAPDGLRNNVQDRGERVTRVQADGGLTRFVFFERDGRVSVRNWDDGGEICRLPDDIINPMGCGPFSPDGRLLCVRMFRDLAPRVWDCQEKRWLERLSPGHSLLFSHDGKEVISVGNGQLHVLSSLDGTRLRGPFPAEFTKVPRAYAFCPDGVRLVVGESESSTRFKVINAQTGGEIMDAANPPAAAPRCAVWHPDGQSVFLGTEDARIFRWPLNARAVPEVFKGHSGPVVALAVDDSGDWMISQSKDGSTRVWSTVTGKSVAILPFSGELAVMKSEPGGRLRVLCDDSRAKCLVEYLLSPSPVCRQFTLPHRQHLDKAPRGSWAVTFSPDGGLLSAGDTDGVWHYNSETAERLGHAPVGHCWSLAWRRDGRAFYSASATGLQRWPVEQKPDDASADGHGKPEAGGGAGHSILLPPGRPWAQGRMHHISLSQDGGLLALSRDQNVELYTAPRGELLRTLAHTGTPEGNNVDMISLCPDALYLALARKREKQAMILKTGTGELLRAVPSEYVDPAVLISSGSTNIYTGDLGKLTCTELKTGKTLWSRTREKLASETLVMAQSGDGKLLAAALSPDVVHLLDAATGREYARFRHPFPQRTAWLAFSPDGSRLAVLCIGRQVQLWDLRRLRTNLEACGLDWSAPAFPPHAGTRTWSVQPMPPAVQTSGNPPPAEEP